MESRAVVSDRLDSLDAERFKAMIESPAFEILSNRWAAELERARLDCENHSHPSDIHRSQGAVRALRAVVGLPATILAEFARGPRRL